MPLYFDRREDRFRQRQVDLAVTLTLAPDDIRTKLCR
jgi:hypothetical protein